MSKQSVSNPRFSPKKSDLHLEECQRELGQLKKELENVKVKTLEVKKKCSMELKQYKENAEKEKTKLVDDLRSKWEHKKTRELQQLKESMLREREMEVKQLLRCKEELLKEQRAFLEKDREKAVRQARELQKQLIEELVNKGYAGKTCSTKNEPISVSAQGCKCRLQDVLSKLRWDYDGEQAAHIRHLKAELKLEKNLFMSFLEKYPQGRKASPGAERWDNRASTPISDASTSKGIGAHRKQAWREVEEAVNAVLVCRQTVEGIKKLWTDCKRNVKHKMGDLAAHARATGGGPPSSITFNGQEQLLQENLSTTEAEGIPSDCDTGDDSSLLELVFLEMRFDTHQENVFLPEEKILLHSTMHRASESSEEAWVFEAVARCSLMHSPLLASTVQDQECDAAVPSELPNGVGPLVMFSSCDVPTAPLVDGEHPVVQVLKGSLPMERLMDVDPSVLELKAAILPNKDCLTDPSVLSNKTHNHVTLVEEHIGNVCSVTASLDLSVAKLSRNKLQGIKCVSVPTDNQEVPVYSHENGIRPSSTESLLKPLDTVSQKEGNDKAPYTNGSNNSEPKQDEELLNALRALEQRCNALKEENILLRKSCFPETEEKVKRLKRKNAELAVIAKRLEERAQKLQEANLKMVNTPLHLRGASLEVCKKAFARQRAKDLSEQASALLAKDKQIETLKQECHELQGKLSAGKDFPSWLKLSDFDRLLRESQKEVLRLQRQIAIKYLKETLHVSRSDSQSSPVPDAVRVETLFYSDEPTECPDKSGKATLLEGIKESELRKKRKECEILEQEVKKKQKRCEELETKLQEVQTENARLVEENSRLSSRVKWTGKVESENADLRGHLVELTEQRDSALKESHRLQSKLDNLEQVLKHMRDVAERRQQLEKDHEDALIALQKRQEEVKRVQQAQVEAKKEHEGAVQLLENTLDSLQAKVKLLEEKCRSQTEQFTLLSQELQRFRQQTGNIDLLTSTLVTSELPPPQCCSTPGLPKDQQDRRGDSLDVKEPGIIRPDEKNKEGGSGKQKPLPHTTIPSCETSHVETQDHVVAKEKQKWEFPHSSSKSESSQESAKYCPTPEVDTASEMEELEADSVSLNPEPEHHAPAKLQVFLARYSYDPFDGPNENPEAELPLTAGEYIYIYGDMDDDGFYEGELMDGRRGLVPSNFVERVSDDDLMAFQPVETNELSQSSEPDISFLSGSSIERSEDDDRNSLSPLPCLSEGNSEGTSDASAVPYPLKLTLIKQLARSVVVGWEPPLVTAGSANIQSYNIYVDNELRQNVRCGGQTKALIEKLELKTRTYRISVQSMTDSGCSDRMRCTMLIGYGYSLAPTQLRVRSLSATSAEITWQPCNSNYSHALYLNEEGCGLAKAGTYWYSFSSLRPSTMYNVKVETRPQKIPWELPLERREQKTTVMQLTTPSAGPPDAPLDVQVELGPTPGVLLISWLPVTIDAAGTSNGVRVIGYAVYADGQKVLEVTSPTAGSVLVGMSHLQLLQVSREISVRTMSPSGESVDSVPAKIPAALLNVPDCSSLLNSLSNSSLICQPAANQSLDSCSEKFPSNPLTSSSPCSPPPPLASSSKAKFSIHTSCSRGESIDSLPVRISSHHLLSPLRASSDYCQGSSSTESPETLISQQCKAENAPSLLPQAASSHIPVNLHFPTKTHDSLELTNTTSQERGSRLQNECVENVSDTKESENNAQSVQSSLPRTQKQRKAWSKDRLMVLGTVAKEDCSNLEAGLSEEAEHTNHSMGSRGISIEDFLQEEDQEIKETSGTGLIDEVLDHDTLLPAAHVEVSHIEHSRSSTLSDILEEEEEEEEEDNLSVDTCAKKWGQAVVSSGEESSGKLDCCETDSDEEILERILALPLQKHCSKKLFSIPEVTEEEDDEEENFSLPVAKTPTSCNVQIQKYKRDVQSVMCLKMPEIFTKKPTNDTCANLNTETCVKEDILKTSNASCLVEDDVFIDQNSHLKARDGVSQQPPDSLKSFASESPTWDAKKSYPLNERASYCPEYNRKRPSDAREQCSRLSANSYQTVPCNPRGQSLKDQAVYGTVKDFSRINHKSGKVKARKCSQRHCPTQPKAKTFGTCNSRPLEIDIEYDTEDEEEPAVPVNYLPHTRSNAWEKSSLTEQDGWSERFSQSEPNQYNKRRELKRQVKLQDGGTEMLKGAPSLLRGRDIQEVQKGNSTDDPGSRLATNKYERTARWDCAGKVTPISPVHKRDAWNGDPRSSLLPSPMRVPPPVRNTRASQLTSESEPACNAPPECHQTISEEKQSPLKTQELDSVRIFVALFDYDPVTMSPNPDAYEAELPFKEGQVLQVFGDKDADGFYRGECAGKSGYIPCNMVSELHIQSEDIKVELLQQGCVTSPSLLNDLGISAFSPPSPSPLAPPGRLAIPPPKPRRSKKVQMTCSPDKTNAPEKSQRTSTPDLSVPRTMVAIFDYNPRESSPNMDVEAELSFTAGDVITVFGPMDEDGFYYGELNGQRGLVPSNFLEMSQSMIKEASPQAPLNLRGDELSFEVSIVQSDSAPEDPISCDQAEDSKPMSESQDLYQSLTSSKKKKSFFSKGRKLFKKLGSSGKNL
ncbi:peripheral-type benzodiazepine receptor-associated protein 1 [Rhinophrynus dorsalis]